jgi:hypothetical protein
MRIADTSAVDGCVEALKEAIHQFGALGSKK